MRSEQNVSEKWGKPNSQTWVHRPKLTTIYARGGNHFACARAMQGICPQGKTVDNKQLERWIKANKPWACWIPDVLAPALDVYLATLTPDESSQLPPATELMGKTPVIEPGGNAATSFEAAVPPPPIALLQIVLVPGTPAPKDARFANFFIESYGAQAVPEGGDFEMFYEVYCEPYEICGYVVGFSAFEIHFDLPEGEGRSWRRIESAVERGAVIVEPRGVKIQAFVRFVAKTPPLRLNLLVSEDTLGAFCGARAGDKLTARMEASLDAGFVQQRRSAPPEEDAKRINAKRVKELLARKKVFADLQADEDNVVLAKQVLTVREFVRPK